MMMTFITRRGEGQGRTKKERKRFHVFTLRKLGERLATLRGKLRKAKAVAFRPFPAFFTGTPFPRTAKIWVHRWLRDCVLTCWLRTPHAWKSRGGIRRRPPCLFRETTSLPFRQVLRMLLLSTGALSVHRNGVGE